MKEVKVILPDGSERRFKSGITVKDVAFDIGPRLGKAAVAGKVNGQLVDLDFPIESDVNLEIITLDSEEGLEIYRHSAAHIMAQAVKRVYGKDVKLAIGPAIEDGFYYDFDLEERISPEDLEKIEAEMKKIIKEDLKFKRFELPRNEALAKLKEMGEDYKVELVEELKDETVSFYEQGEFVDLCRGPHLPSTGYLKAFKLMSVAGAYWRGDEKNPMLQRIYGTAFPKVKELEQYLHRLEEAKKRDHRKIGRELELFSLSEYAPGFPFILPKGMVIINELINFWREEHQKAGYQEIRTPLIMNEELWKQSGHYEHYKENMYFTEIDDQGYAVKPMNCPGGVLVYKFKKHSYREFPIRTAELGLVHRHELSGTLHGLMRVRAFTQDDAHIFMTPDQIKDELINVINLIDRIYSVFGFKYHVELSTKPEKAMGSDEIWEKAISALKGALEALNLDYKINEGDGAFYGPKIDFHLEDCLGRTWQCGTIQLDFLMPERFDLTYVGPDGEEHRPVMIHRVVYGSLERFLGVLIEHYAGAFPVWLAPIQVEVIPVMDNHLEYAYQVEKKLSEAGIRVEVDSRSEKVGYKIRSAQLNQVPYMLIVGDREIEDGTVSVRERRKGDLGSFKVEEFIEQILNEIKEKK
ncbi:threonine--tRNA ligase [Anoxybacter fermentans]|uniref:Threonine--tRNA ligase n=1 Tax=Anoxybacter fermentans TaxID=1323375 RepID=A0A3Q9HR97_9FIRM|nr:threonine--tRNA ligase [Anoxybacter fermentans]AZR73679.1 threonine--tRNA ligase [Anoxybacter fermentans]